MTTRRLILPVLGLVLTLTACSTVQMGRDFDLRTFASKVQRGVTTQAQIRGWLGAPASTGVVLDTSGKKYDEWTYYYGEGRLPNMVDASIKILQIKFDNRGIVQGYNWSGEAGK